MYYIQRIISKNLTEYLNSFQAVFLGGPRQAGKSTLIRELLKNFPTADYITFDDLTARAAAETDPEGFLEGFKNLVVLDEIQLAPQLFLPIKKRIDDIRYQNLKSSQEVPCLFLLTGSAGLNVLPELANALVGRLGILTLYPFSSIEILKKPGGFIHSLFKDEFYFKEIDFDEKELEKVIMESTFPELALKQTINKNLWLNSYVNTLLQRDLPALSDIEKITTLPIMLKILAARAGGLLNDASLARDTGLNTVTYRRYRALLEAVFLLISIPPWFSNIGKRLMKSPKIYFLDTMLLCHSIGIELSRLKETDPRLFGIILENYVASELTKQLSATFDQTLYHFRTQDNKEIDFVIEKTDGRLVGIEVKAKKNLSKEDFHGLQFLQDALGDKFVRGVVLYSGNKIIPFGSKLFAVPISALWN